MNHWVKKVMVMTVGVLWAANCWGQFYQIELDDHAELRSLQQEAQKLLNTKNNTQQGLDTVSTKLYDYTRQYSEGQYACLITLGDLFRCIQPAALKNPNKALEHYEDALAELDPNDSIRRAKTYERIAATYELMNDSRSSHTVLHYLNEAARYDPHYASSMGDYYLFGWGVPQNLFLAEGCYWIAIHNGNADALGNHFYVQYMLQQDLSGQLDTEAVQDFEHSIYHLMNRLNWDSVLYWMKKAADRGYAPAQYELSGVYVGGMIHGSTEENYAKGVELIKKASGQDYAMATYHYAVLTKDLELMHRSAESGNPSAMKDLGKHYASIEPERALYWWLLRSEVSPGNSLVWADSIIRTAHLDTTTIEQVQEKVTEHYRVIEKDHTLFFNKILHSQHFATPKYLPTAYNTAKHIDIHPKDPTAEQVSVVRSYKTLYDLYAREVAQHLDSETEFIKHHVDWTQDMMRFTRQLAEGVLDDPFPISPLESAQPQKGGKK